MAHSDQSSGVSFARIPLNRLDEEEEKAVSTSFDEVEMEFEREEGTFLTSSTSCSTRTKIHKDRATFRKSYLNMKGLWWKEEKERRLREGLPIGEAEGGLS